MSFAPSSGVVQGAAQLGDTVAVSLLEASVSAKFMDVSSVNVVEVNSGFAEVEMVTEADALDVYQEQSSTPGLSGIVVAATGATYESTVEELPSIKYARPLYFAEVACVRATAPETPSKCQAHCGTVPTDEPVEFEPSIAAFAELKLAMESVRPISASGATIIAITFLNISIPF